MKAILQYSAQPLPGANLLQQGAGLLNIDGAVTLAQALRTDLASAIASGSISAGQSMLASSARCPAAKSTLVGGSFDWSRIVYAGGNSVVSGSALFTKYQPIWDPRLAWANGVVFKRTPTYWSAGACPASTYVKSFSEARVPNQQLLTWGVVRADALVGASSLVGQTGIFMPTATLVEPGLPAAADPTLAQGIVLSEGAGAQRGPGVERGPGAQRRPGVERRAGAERGPGAERRVGAQRSPFAASPEPRAGNPQ